MYELRYSNASQRYFKKVKEKGLKEGFQGGLLRIADNPYCGVEKIGDLAGIYGYDIYYNKTNYEITYRIYEENDNIVVVVLAGTRENFYDELKRCMK